MTEEVQQWNSPTLGAYLLWKFTVGYCEAHKHGDAPVAILHFLALPLLTSERLLHPISNRRADLQSYARSFENAKDTDVLVTVHDRVIRHRTNTIDSLDIAISKGLMSWDTESGKVYPSTGKVKARRGYALRAPVNRIGKKAEILGSWFAAHEPATIAAYLKVVL
ncbi:MAG: hypothetical protein GY854_19535 [Deltaproteobacteria bacterium]|nr:hypothetical protein [Deltaproteobacteria bacterium]